MFANSLRCLALVLVLLVAASAYATGGAATSAVFEYSTIHHSNCGSTDRIDTAAKDIAVVYTADFQVAPEVPEPSDDGWSGFDRSGSVGDFAQVYGPVLAPLDGCLPNATPVLAFLDPATPCQTWCYSGQTGTVNPTVGLHNIFVSPPITWDGGLGHGASFQFDVYRHFPQDDTSPGTGYVWYVRSVVSGDIEQAPWVSRDMIYHGSPGWITHTEDVSDLLVQGRTVVQVALGVRNAGPAAPAGADMPPAPYFDNVILAAFPVDGPVITALELDLAQDGFPDEPYNVLYENLDVSFDAARNTAVPPAYAAADVITATITAVNPGTNVVGTPQLHYQVDPNPNFSISRLPLIGSVAGVNAGGDTWTFDPPDQDLFYPGDVIHYYIEAADDAFITSTLPADISAFGDFGAEPAYDKVFTVRALPGLKSHQPFGIPDSPPILFWDDGPAQDGDSEWQTALGQLGFSLSDGYDLYATNAPAAGEGNGLGSSATQYHLMGYDCIIYSSSDLAANTLIDRFNGDDAGADLDVIGLWFDQDVRYLVLSGDNLASDLSLTGAGLNFLQSRMGIQVVDRSARGMVLDQISPLVGSTSTFFWPSGTNWRVDGQEPGLNEFDALSLYGGFSFRIAEFLDPSGQQGISPLVAMAVATPVPSANNTIVTMPYDLGFLTTGKVAGGTAAAIVLEGILDSFNVFGGSAASMPAVDHSSVSIAGGAAPPLSLPIVPGRGGRALSEAFEYGGTPYDGTIQISLYERPSTELVDFPANALSIVTGYPDANPNLPPAFTGQPVYSQALIADADTDANGLTTLSRCPIASGDSDWPAEKAYVSAGTTVLWRHPLDLYFNSPDLDADLVVDLIDLASFTRIYHGPYDYSIDYVWNGTMNLSDLAVLKQSMCMGEAWIDKWVLDPDSFLFMKLGDAEDVAFIGWGEYGIYDLELWLSASGTFGPVDGYACRVHATPTSTVPYVQAVSPNYALDAINIADNITGGDAGEFVVGLGAGPDATGGGQYHLGTVQIVWMPFNYGPMEFLVGPQTGMEGCDYMDERIFVASGPDMVLLPVPNGEPVLRINPEEPVVTSIADVPDDQGLSVRIDTWRSGYDAPGGPLAVTHYEVYREQPDKLDGWDLVSTVPADGVDLKQFIVSTPCDWSVTDPCDFTYMVRACTADPQVFFDSDPVTGHSIDNIVPIAVEGLAAHFYTDHVDLDWSAHGDPDIVHYNVYRNTDPDTPPAGEPHVQVAGTSWTDDLSGMTGAVWDQVYWISAVDDAGQEGSLSVWSEFVVSGVGHGLPRVFALHGNVPNPFNPETTIHYDLPADAMVNLDIFDVAGARVRVLRSGTREAAGRRTAVWDGRDSAGARVASGVYFCRLETDSFRSTKRMLLMK